MDSKNLSNPRLADLALSSYSITAAVSDIPGAAISIAGDDVEVTIADFDADATIIDGRFGTEYVLASLAAGVVTLTFTAAATATSVITVNFSKKV
jgi:hypothetical protein